MNAPSSPNTSPAKVAIVSDRAMLVNINCAVRAEVIQQAKPIRAQLAEILEAIERLNKKCDKVLMKAKK